MENHLVLTRYDQLFRRRRGFLVHKNVLHDTARPTPYLVETAVSLTVTKCNVRAGPTGLRAGDFIELGDESYMVFQRPLPPRPTSPEEVGTFDLPEGRADVSHIQEALVARDFATLELHQDFDLLLTPTPELRTLRRAVDAVLVYQVHHRRFQRESEVFHHELLRRLQARAPIGPVFFLDRPIVSDGVYPLHRHRVSEEMRSRWAGGPSNVTFTFYQPPLGPPRPKKRKRPTKIANRHLIGTPIGEAIAATTTSRAEFELIRRWKEQMARAYSTYEAQRNDTDRLILQVASALYDDATWTMATLLLQERSLHDDRLAMYSLPERVLRASLVRWQHHGLVHLQNNKHWYIDPAIFLKSVRQRLAACQPRVASGYVCCHGHGCDIFEAMTAEFTCRAPTQNGPCGATLSEQGKDTGDVSELDALQETLRQVRFVPERSPVKRRYLAGIVVVDPLDDRLRPSETKGPGSL